MGPPRRVEVVRFAVGAPSGCRRLLGGARRRRSGAAALFAAAAGALCRGAAAAERGVAGTSCSSAGLSDETCLVQASGLPLRVAAPANRGEELLADGRRTSEEGTLCDAPILDATEPGPNLQPNFASCKAFLKSAVEAGCTGSACDVVFVGDSIFERLGGRACYLLAPHPNVLRMNKVFNQTFRYASSTLFLAGAGDSTPQTLYMMDMVLPILRSPKVFIVMVGTNNIGNCCSTAEEAARGAEAVIERLRYRHPTSRILMHPLLNRAGMGCCGYPMQPLVDSVNEKLKAYASSLDEQVQWADCSHVFPPGWNETVRELMPDKLHPSEKGYEEWMQCLNPLFHEVLR